MSRIRIGITGSRTFENKAKIKTLIFKLKERTNDTIEIVSLGDKNGADKYVKKYALELGYEYKEMNPAHTTKTLYSLMTESYYQKPYAVKNLHQQVKIYSQYVDSCIILDDTNNQDKKVQSVLKQLTKSNKKAIIITP